MYDEPGRRSIGDILLHPLTISLLLAAGVYATCTVPPYLERARYEAVDEALAPIREEWRALGEAAGARLGAALAILEEGGESAGTCGRRSGEVTVIARPLLERLAPGDRPARDLDPSWMSSDVWLHLASYLIAPHEVEAQRRRNAALRSAIEAPCLGIFDAALADDARISGERRFEGGDVVGVLRIVCVDAGHVACEAAIVSSPFVAITVKQRSAEGQRSADARAVQDGAAWKYWDTLGDRLREVAPGLVLRRRLADE
ncbi:MAG: hypothetical protein H6710_24580 [Myxococcales bacterium]|nr:hypothetical protein [Myxococcales bacterium]